jgi:penicillin-binding protein 1C
MSSLSGTLRQAWGLTRCALVLGLFSLGWPVRMPEKPLSAVLEDREGRLLGARIAADGQWRFPSQGAIPPKMAEAVILFEDAWYSWHPGVNPVSILRALRVNRRAGRVRQGGSTIPMQLIRLNRDGQPRTWREKLLEAHGALRLTCQYSKTSVLSAFLERAPFGGNVVGLEAACWRYYGKSPAALSWGEAAALAVLPNSPALIHPGRNPESLRRKRDGLLVRMQEHGLLDAAEAALARSEPLPSAPQALPRLATELLDRLLPAGGGRIRSTLDGILQERVREVMSRHHQRLRGNGIRHMAVLLLDNRENRVLVYAGNAPDGQRGEGSEVDIIRARRSPGSTLKPFLYAWALQDGLIWPGSLLADIPTQYGSYRPENFYRDFQGMVPARQAIASSLNIPMVRLLRDYGTARFLQRLRRHGFRSLDRPADHYGLSLVLGGGEVSLWELTLAYGQVARILNRFNATDGAYDAADLAPPRWTLGPSPPSAPRGDPAHLHAGAIWQMLEAMCLPDRPEEATNWDYFTSSRKVAWKTGTSFGFKDAWSVAVTPDYTLGVWVGNADGEPRADLTGIKAAAPLLFDVLALLPSGSWFAEPWDDLEWRAACGNSGLPVGPYCPTDTVLTLAAAPAPGVCPYHQRIYRHPQSGLRVDGGCMAPDLAISADWFVLPPVESHYFSRRNPDYQALPGWHPGCGQEQQDAPIRLIYPTPHTRLAQATGLGGRPQPIVFQATHRENGRTLHWHLDEHYLGSTMDRHQWSLAPSPGPHILTLTDDQGRSLRYAFHVGL